MEKYLMWLWYIILSLHYQSFLPHASRDLWSPMNNKFWNGKHFKVPLKLRFFYFGMPVPWLWLPGIQGLAGENCLLPDTHPLCHLLHEVNTECYNLFLFCSGIQIRTERLWAEPSFSSVASLRNRLFPSLLCKVLDTPTSLWSYHVSNFRSFEHFKSKYLKMLLRN